MPEIISMKTNHQVNIIRKQFTNSFFHIYHLFLAMWSEIIQNLSPCKAWNKFINKIITNSKPIYYSSRAHFPYSFHPLTLACALPIFRTYTQHSFIHWRLYLPINSIPSFFLHITLQSPFTAPQILTPMNSNTITILLLLLLLLFLLLSQNSDFALGGKRRVHITDDLDDVYDDEEDDAWREWGKKPAPSFPPSDLSNMEPSQIKEEMKKRHVGPVIGFVKLRLGVRRTPVRGNFDSTLFFFLLKKIELEF